MALDFQKVPVPVSQGLAENIDERLAPVGKLLHARNVIWDKDGRVSCRPAFERLTNLAYPAGGPLIGPHTLFSSGSEVCAMYGRRLFGLSEEVTKWIDRGKVSPYCMQQRVVWADRMDLQQSDMYEDIHGTDGYLAYVSAAYEGRTDATEANSDRHVLAGVLDTSGQVISPRQTLDTGGESGAVNTKPHSVRAFGSSTELLVSWLKRTTNEGTDADILIHGALLSGPHAGFKLVNFLDDAYHDDYNQRTYDAIALADGSYLVAWCRTAAGDLRLEVFNTAHASVTSRNIAPPGGGWSYIRVAICEDTDNSNIYMMTVRDDGAGNQHLEVWGLNYVGGLPTLWGPTILSSITAATDHFDNIGVVWHDLGLDRVLCVWGHHEHLAAPVAHSGWKTSHESLTGTTGVIRDNISTIYNCVPTSKPFVDNNSRDATGLAYCVIRTMTNDACSYVYEAQGCYELVEGADVETAGDFDHCGTWDPGLSNSMAFQGNLRCGSCNSIAHSDGHWTTEKGTHRMADTVRADTLETVLGGSFHHKFASTYVAFDFESRPTAARIDRGCTLFGGGMVQSYDGTRVDELSYVFPPVIDTVVGAAGGGSLPVDTYFFQTTWDTFDHAGNWHRSAPSRQVTHSQSEIGNAKVYTRSLPQTRRKGYTQVFSASFYANDSTGVSRVLQRPEQVIRSRGYDTDVYTDATYLNLPFSYDALNENGRGLYTDSGELATVAPMGARLCMVQNERVWLAGMVRPDFVQFSKRYTPGLATTPLVAPEFSEGFGFATPNGRDITGLGKVDDKVVVFTEREVYALTGRGPNDDGSGDDHSGLMSISTDAGCKNARSVCSYPGGVFFESEDGLWHVDRGLRVTRLGEAVEDTLATWHIISDACVWPERNLCVFAAHNGVALGGLLVFDYATGNWCDWVILNGVAADVIPVAVCVHDGKLYVSDKSTTIYRSYYGDGTTPHKDDSANWIPMEIETAWIQSAGQSGWQRVKTVQVLLGEVLDHDLRVSVYHDFEAVNPLVKDWTDAQINAFASPGLREQVQVRLDRQKTQAVKIRVESRPASAGGVYTPGPTIAGLMLEIGQKRGAAKMPTTQRR